MPYLSAITSLPWRFLLGLLAGLTLAMGYHAYTLRGIELAETERQRQHQLDLWVAQKNAQEEVARIDQYWHDKMQRDLAAVPNPKRVFVNAKCPSLPATGNTGMDSGAGKPELDESGRQALRELRLGIVQVEKKLAACQEILKSRQPKPFGADT